MTEFLQRISITCFAASYTILFAIEISRFMFRIRVRNIVAIGLSVAGLFAHTVFLFAQSRIDPTAGIPLSSWDSWCLVIAWLLMLTHLIQLFRTPENPAGLLSIPIALGLIGISYFVRDSGPFSPAQAKYFWNVLHGLALLAATFSVTIGFVAGMLYLVEAYRLKHKRPERRFRFPSLERLQFVSERTLIVSSCLLALGFVSGVVINLINQSNPNATVQWNDPVVWSSLVLFIWIVVAQAFNMLYRPARYGQKVAYLVVASFVFLCFAIISALLGGHGVSQTPPETASSNGYLLRETGATARNEPNLAVRDQA